MARGRKLWKFLRFAALATLLAAAGFTLYLDFRVRSEFVQDVSDFYEQNRAQFNIVETQYRVSQIVITPRKDQVRNRKNDDATTDAEARRKGAALLAQIHDAADVAQLAMDYSEDPS